MENKTIAIMLILAIVAVFCAWLVSNAVMTPQLAESTTVSGATYPIRVSLDIKEAPIPSQNTVSVSMSIIEPGDK